MIRREPGGGQVYVTTKRDSDWRFCAPSGPTRLHVPASVPAAQFWALTLYCENTRRPYGNGGTDYRSVTLDSRDQSPQRSADGGIDRYVGSAATR
jgi:hypothetical protein